MISSGFSLTGTVPSDDTIAAVATPYGVGGIGTVRLSGPASLTIASSVFHSSRPADTYETHRIYHGWVFSNESKIDEVLLSYMAGPNSYTGEDVVEISCHGGLATVRSALRRMADVPSKG